MREKQRASLLGRLHSTEARNCCLACHDFWSSWRYASLSPQVYLNRVHNSDKHSHPFEAFLRTSFGSSGRIRAAKPLGAINFRLPS